MTRRITINRAALKDAIKRRLLARIAADYAGEIKHGNHDANTRPSSWWGDRAHTQRHTCVTSASIAVTDGALVINLDFSF